MKRKELRNFCITGCLLLMFLLWTMLILFVDVQAIGPEGSVVGFAIFNGFFHNLTGVHMLLYTITDWLGLVPLFVVLGFAMLGLVQLIDRRNLLKVDYDILVLGGFYIIVLLMYSLFELLPINYRPVLINGVLEASYPSSTTLLVMCVMPTAIMQFRERIVNQSIKKIIEVIIVIFIVFMVVGRSVSGVHWFTDIIGGVLLSSGLVMLHYSVRNINQTSSYKSIGEAQWNIESKW